MHVQTTSATDFESRQTCEPIERLFGRVSASHQYSNTKVHFLLVSVCDSKVDFVRSIQLLCTFNKLAGLGKYFLLLSASSVL